MENIAYFIWLIIGLIGVLIGLYSVINEKFKGETETFARKLFSSGIFFTLFMLISAVVIYIKLGLTLIFIVLIAFFLGGIIIVIDFFRKK